MRLICTRVLIAALAAVTLVAIGYASQPLAQAGGGPTIRVSPSFQNVQVGQNVNVNINVQNAPIFASYEFHLAFDPSVLEFVSVTGGGNMLASGGRDPFCLGPQADDLANAIVSYGCASSGGSGGPSGSGTLATVRFRAVCPGNINLAFVPVGFDLSIAAVSLGTPLGSSIPTLGVGGEVNVNGPSCGSTVLRGDANCNGVVNAVDAALILQIVAGLIGPPTCSANADVNRDGQINAIDAALVLQYIAGLIGRL